jgi:hypothetical protein
MSRTCSITDLSTPRRSFADHAKMSRSSRRNCMSSSSILVSSMAEMTTCLLLLHSNRVIVFVSSAGCALCCCSSSSCEASFAFGFSLSRLWTFFYLGVVISSAIRAWSWSPYTAITPLAEGSFLQR